MQKILFMANTLYSGGAERVLQTVLNYLDRDKYEITLYSLHRENIDRDIYSKPFNYKVVFDKYSGKNVLFKTLSEIYLKIKGIIFNYCPIEVFNYLFIRGRYDVEIAFIEGESTKIVSGSGNKNSKKLAWVHIDLEKNPWTSFLYKNDLDERNHYNKFDQIICVSEATRQAFLRKYHIDEEKVIVHYNPIDTQFILDKSSELSICLKHDIIHIMAVGRLVEQKGFDRLLEAVEKLKQKNIVFQLHILGEGKQKEDLQSYVTEHDLGKYVKLYGYVKNPYTIMRAGDILVCSSRAEGYSLVIAEAMVLGLAVITTNCSGPYELIDGGKYGILTENSTEGIYEALERVLKNKKILERYKALALERSKMFNVQHNIQAIEQIIDKRNRER